MNNNKNIIYVSPWSLYPSKRFPGKCYFYNITNGESYWCGDIPSETIFKSLDHSVPNNGHHYPDQIISPERNVNNIKRCLSGLSHTKDIDQLNIKDSTLEPTVTQIPNVMCHTNSFEDNIQINCTKESHRFCYQQDKNNNNKFLTLYNKQSKQASDNSKKNLLRKPIINLKYTDSNCPKNETTSKETFKKKVRFDNGTKKMLCKRKDDPINMKYQEPKNYTFKIFNNNAFDDNHCKKITVSQEKPSNKSNSNSQHVNLFLLKPEDFDPFIINRSNCISSDTNSCDQAVFEITAKIKKLNLGYDEGNVYGDSQIPKHQNISNSQFSYLPSKAHLNSNSSNISTINLLEEQNDDDELSNVANSECSSKKLSIEMSGSAESDNFSLGSFDNNKIDDIEKTYDALENYVEKFPIEDKRDEIICCYTQIMEEFICNTAEIKFLPPTYSLRELLLQLKDKFCHLQQVVENIDKMLHLNVICPKSGYIKPKTCPKLLVMIIYSGILLVDAFKEHGVDTCDTDESMNCLLRDVQEPLRLRLLQPHTVQRISGQKIILKKLENLKYLQKYFPNRKSKHKQISKNDELPAIENMNKAKVIFLARGKDLDMMKINNKNQMYLESPKDTGDVKKNNIKDKDKTESKVIKNVNKNKIDTNKLKDIKQMLDTANVGKLNDGDSDFDDAFAGLDENSFDKFDKCDDNESYEKYTRKQANGYKNKHEEAYEFIKALFMELSCTYRLIYAFIDECYNRFSQGEPTDLAKKTIHGKATYTYTHLMDIIDKLKSIVQRETQKEGTLQSQVANAVGAAEDKRILLYRKIMTKFLEQTRLMENSLKIILKLSDEDCAASVDSELPEPSYINIFE